MAESSRLSPIDDSNNYIASRVYPPKGLPPVRDFIDFIDSREYPSRPQGELEWRVEAYRNVEENRVFDIPGVTRVNFPLSRNTTGVPFTPRNARQFIARDRAVLAPVFTPPPPVPTSLFQTLGGEVERSHNSGSPFNIREVAQLGDRALAASSSVYPAQLASSRTSSKTLANASTPHAQNDQHDNRQIHPDIEIVAPRPQRQMVVLSNIERAADQFEAAGVLILLGNDLGREFAPLDDQPPCRTVAGGGQQLPSHQQLGNGNPSDDGEGDQGPAVPYQAAQAPPVTRPQNEETASASMQVHRAPIDIDEAAASRQVRGQGKQSESYERVMDGYVRTWSGSLRKVQAIDADPKAARQQSKNQWDNWREKVREKRPHTSILSVDGYEAGDSDLELSDWEDKKKARKRSRRHLYSDAES